LGLGNRRYNAGAGQGRASLALLTAWWEPHQPLQDCVWHGGAAPARSLLAWARPLLVLAAPGRREPARRRSDGGW